MIEIIVLSVMLNPEPQMVEGALFNEYDYVYVIEARRRGKRHKGDRRRGGGGLR